MDIGFDTDIGLKRINNEDAYFIDRRRNFFVVADGVGGSKSGEVASQTAIDEISNYINEHPLIGLNSDEDISKYLRNCVKEANFRILELSQKSETNRGMATTIVIAYIKNKTLYVLNVGDSRAYILHNHVLFQITEDHTYVNMMLKAGAITEEEAKTHERKNEITRAVGADYLVDADLFKVPIKPGDSILLCTDGLYEGVNDEKLVDAMEKNETSSVICHNLIDMANSSGGYDNITAIIIKITEEDFR